MPRALRLESENASYHVFNRGNYRGPVFAATATKRAFLRCLAESCRKSGWRVHAWVVMSNHFHLAVTTPRANLAAGMHWLECTFATRFNRFRSERGHVFQGRFTSIAVKDGDPLASVMHYIHLNPVRAHLCTVGQLGKYPWASVHWIHRPGLRPAWFDPSPALQHAGGLVDSPDGRRAYVTYLEWLAEDEPAQKQQRFDRMTRGWALGSTEFVRGLMAENRAVRPEVQRLAAEMREDYEAQWQEELRALLQRLGRDPAELFLSGKSVEWKVALAAALKTRTTITNRWLSENLHLGNRHEIGRKVAAWLRSPSADLAAKLDIFPTPHNPTP